MTGQIWPRSATSGSQGPAGVGVPTGGTIDQVLAKTSATDYATAWTSISKITVSATAPTSPGLNDLWVDLS